MTDRYADVEALIAREPASHDGARNVAAAMRRLCAAAGRALSASGAGLTVMADGGLRGMTAASDPATERLEELQLTLGEGPCIDAYASMRPVLIPDLAGEAMTRWPAYAPAVHAEGVQAVFAFPLQIGAARLGMLDVFRAAPGMLSPDELALALSFAEVAVSIVLDGHRDNTREGDAGLEEFTGSRAALFQAQGMVMVQLKVSLAEAMVRMRAYAYANDRQLGDVAADVVAGRFRFDGDPQQPQTTTE